jgi:starch phosphorylase
VNTLRLWHSAATDEFDLGEFNAGSYTESVSAKNDAEHITMVLYPNDASENGKELRLRQQYFLASASLQDILRSWTDRHGMDFTGFAAKITSSSTTPIRPASCPN